MTDFSLTFKSSSRSILGEMRIKAATNGLLTIGQTAEQAGLATSALRFYEREQLIRPAQRTRAGYRLYDPAAVERLRFIRAGQAIGFTLKDIRALMVLDGDSPCKPVRALIEQRLADVDAKLADLESVRATLADALRRCRRSRKGCAVVADLKRTSKQRRSDR